MVVKISYRLQNGKFAILSAVGTKEKTNPARRKCRKEDMIMTKKKTLILIPIVLMLTIMASALAPMTAAAYEGDEDYTPRLTAPDSSIPYYSSQLNWYHQTGTPMPNCVAYAYGRIYEMNGEKPLIPGGNAGEWYGMNKAAGYYPYGQEPKVGAVACWSRHVAIVEKVNADGSVTISESHWGGTYFDVRTYEDMTSHYGQAFYGYIYAYNGGMTTELRNKLINAKQETNTQYQQDTNVAPEEVCEFSITNLDREDSDKEESIFARFFS